jgi:hypothetical protein
MDSLRITEQPVIDETVESFQYREYEPQNPQAVNNLQAIQIDIQSQDVYTQPSKSYLYIEGKLESTAGGENAYKAETLVTLINNAVPFMFSQIRYQINNIEIENVMNPGQATTMKGLLTYGREMANGEGLNMCWMPDSQDAASDENVGFKGRRSYIIVMSNPVGSFSFAVPLGHLFGFCGDYDKVVYGIKQSLILARQNDADAIYRANAASDGRIVLGKISWMMPHIIPSIDARLALEKVIVEKTTIPLAFRAMQCDTISVPKSTNFSWRLTVKTGTEKPRWMIIGFQSGKSLDQKRNPALFDHVGVTNIFALLNSERYPLVDSNLSFSSCRIAKTYKAACDFKKEYYGTTDKESSVQFSPTEFINLFPLFVIDVRMQSEKLQNSVQDIQIKTTFSQNPPDNTTAYALLISDRLLNLRSDGNRFQIMY